MNSIEEIDFPEELFDILSTWRDENGNVKLVTKPQQVFIRIKGRILIKEFQTLMMIIPF